LRIAQPRLSPDELVKADFRREGIKKVDTFAFLQILNADRFLLEDRN
jgi:hypothetical protein